jgi:hypothetical protein
MVANSTKKAWQKPEVRVLTLTDDERERLFPSKVTTLKAVAGRR